MQSPNVFDIDRHGCITSVRSLSGGICFACFLQILTRLSDISALQLFCPTHSAASKALKMQTIPQYYCHQLERQNEKEKTSLMPVPNYSRLHVYTGGYQFVFRKLQPRAWAMLLIIGATKHCLIFID